jgi:hypothetical protein
VLATSPSSPPSCLSSCPSEPCSPRPQEAPHYQTHGSHKGSAHPSTWESRFTWPEALKHLLASCPGPASATARKLQLDCVPFLQEQPLGPQDVSLLLLKHTSYCPAPSWPYVFPHTHQALVCHRPFAPAVSSVRNTDPPESSKVEFLISSRLPKWLNRRWFSWAAPVKHVAEAQPC